MVGWFLHRTHGCLGVWPQALVLGCPKLGEQDLK